jgi:molybdate transport system substrate-binding protein
MKFLNCLLVFIVLSGPVRASSSIVVAAAASLKFVLADAVLEYSKKFPDEPQIKLVFGASGQLYSQIRQGAPYDVFLSADEEQVNKLQGEGFTGSGMVYARGRLVLIRPLQNTQAPLPSDTSKALRHLVEDPAFQRLAIASPVHAPYGKAAKQVLMHMGLWEAVESKLVVGESVSQATGFALSGSTQGGLVALSSAKSPTLDSKIEFILIDESFHDPLRHKMLLLKPDNQAAASFYEYLCSQDFARHLEAYGFAVN